MLVCVCLIVSNYTVHKKPKHSGHHEIHLACKSISCTLIADCMVWICNRDILSNVKMIQARKGRHSKHAVNFSYYIVSTELNILSLSGTPVFNPLAYTDVCETPGLTRSINTQPAVRRSEPSMSFAFNSSLLSVDCLTWLIPFESW